MNIFPTGEWIDPFEDLLRRRASRLAAVAFALLGLLYDETLAAEVDREQAVFALMAMKDSRERLVSGVFRASGRAQSGDYLRELDVYQAFDFSTGSYRIDETETVLREKAAREPDPRRDVRIRKYARNSAASTHYLGHRDVVIEPPEHPPQPSVKRFDVRAVGITSWSAFEGGGSFENLFPSLLEQEITALSQETSGLIKIAWEIGESREAQRVVWLDPARGHSPIRLELRVRMNPEGDWSAIKAATEATWEEVAGIWVPKSVVLEDHFNATNKYELAFEWESVNEPVSEELFIWQGLDLPHGTLVMDHRLETPIRLGRVGGFVGPTEAELESITRTRIVIVVAALSVGVILLSVFLRWRRERNKA